MCDAGNRAEVPPDELLEEAATAPGGPFQVPAAGPGPEDAAVEAETRRRVVAALAGLPDRYRTAVLLKDGLRLPALAGTAVGGGVSVDHPSEVGVTSVRGARGTCLPGGQLRVLPSVYGENTSDSPVVGEAVLPEQAHRLPYPHDCAREREHGLASPHAHPGSARQSRAR